MRSTPAQQAREAAGYGGASGLKRLARRVNCHPRTIRSAEIHGGGSDNLCRRMGAHLKCDPALYFFPPAYWSKLREAEKVQAERAF
jgi:hypothetical protein